jgi:hypothetical protein
MRGFDSIQLALGATLLLVGCKVWGVLGMLSGVGGPASGGDVGGPPVRPNCPLVPPPPPPPGRRKLQQSHLHAQFRHSCSLPF